MVLIDRIQPLLVVLLPNVDLKKVPFVLVNQEPLHLRLAIHVLIRPCHIYNLVLEGASSRLTQSEYHWRHWLLQTCADAVLLDIVCLLEVSFDSAQHVNGIANLHHGRIASVSQHVSLYAYFHIPQIDDVDGVGWLYHFVRRSAATNQVQRLDVHKDELCPVKRL